MHSSWGCLTTEKTTMASPSKIIQFSDFQKPEEFSQPSQNGAKTVPESDIANIA
jgi:hypothetical protein